MNNLGYYPNWNMRGRGRGGFNRGGGGRGNKRSFWGGDRPNFRGGHSNPRSNFGKRGGRGGWSNKNDSKSWRKRDTPLKRLSEVDIGVTEYVSSHNGFSGIIKSRYSDFQVSEIDEQGVVAKLTNLTPPSPPVDEEVLEDEELLFNKYNLEILPMETWDKINKLFVAKQATSETVELDATNMSKEQRTKIHDAVKKAFGDGIVSSTVNIDDKKLLRFQKYRKGVRIDKRVKWVWPGEYVYFIVHKENWDTMEAASRIADRLRLNIKPSMLGYAGTKDRRAKTTQWFSLRKVDPRKIATSCQELRDIRVGNFKFQTCGLKLGMLKGNQFRIALRNVQADDDVVNSCCSDLRDSGFINYYGLQRFGARIDSPTYQVGRSLLQGNFKEAIDQILQERDGPMEEALRVYKGKGAAAALKVWPNKMYHNTLEVKLLRALASSPNDLLGALNKLARNTRLLYLHSYQSLLWNQCVSMRIKRFGLKPAVGDIVAVDEDITEELCKLEEECLEEEEEDEAGSESGDTETSQNGDQNKMADDKELPKNSLETSTKEVKKIEVKVLTQEDVDSGKYSMLDILMPLPGHLITYPPNMVEYYKELLDKDGLTLEMKHKFKSYTMTGTYRRVVIRPTNVSWRCVRYSDPCADLIMSDWDELQQVTQTGIVEDGKYKALLLTMNLPASCYATMALRELLKMDTSGVNQALMNNYHKEKTSNAVEDKCDENKEKQIVKEEKIKQEMKEDEDKDEGTDIETKKELKSSELTTNTKDQDDETSTKMDSNNEMCEDKVEENKEELKTDTEVRVQKREIEDTDGSELEVKKLKQE